MPQWLLLRLSLLAAVALAIASGCAPTQPTVMHGSQSGAQSGTVTHRNPAGTTNREDTRALDDRMRELAATIVRHLPPPDIDGGGTGGTTGRRTVAVADFVTLDGETSVFGRYVAEELTITLLDTGKVTVVERALLQKALDELQLNATDIVDPEHARQLGRVVGADCVATGTVTDRSADVKINARLIDTERSTVLSGGSVVVRKSSFHAIERPDPATGTGTPNGSGNGSGTASNGYADGYGSPVDAWQVFLTALANLDGDLLLTAVRPPDRYLITHLSLPAFAQAIREMNPRLEGIEYASTAVAIGSIWKSDGEFDNVFFEQHGGRWYVVVNDTDYDPYNPD